MWLMLREGIIMPSLRPEKYLPPGDLRTIQLRARDRSHLNRFRRQYMPLTLGATVELKGTDYEYRAYCTPADFAIALMNAALDIDYVKFKPTTIADYDDHDLHRLYNRIWSVVMDQLGDHKRWGSYWDDRFPNSQKTLTGAKGIGESWSYTTADGKSVTGPSAGRTEVKNDVTTYDSSAGRDEVEPEVWDLPGDLEQAAYNDAMDQQFEDEVDKAFRDVEMLFWDYEQPSYVDHTKCGHGTTSDDEALCRRKKLKVIRSKALEYIDRIDVAIVVDEPAPAGA